MPFMTKLNQYQQTINTYLESVVTTCPAPRLTEAMNYSLLAGGKRIRPVLLLAFCELCGGEAVHALPLACGLEMIHTYSLIHDDLPCMDNDDYRRGQLTNHKVYGETLALLAGDGLLTFAFETMLSAGAHPGRVLKAAYEIAHYAGIHGMVGGQVLDIQAETQGGTADSITAIDLLKTGGLIVGAAKAGCLMAGATVVQIEAAAAYAKALGLAFQIQDDLLDVEGDPALLGKPIGSDAKHAKPTYVALLGCEACREQVIQLTNQAKEALAPFPEKAFLSDLADFLCGRSQ